MLGERPRRVLHQPRRLHTILGRCGRVCVVNKGFKRTCTPACSEAGEPLPLLESPAEWCKHGVSTHVLADIEARVRTSPRLSAFSGGASAQLAAASNGNFQFARAVLDQAAEQCWTPSQVQQLVAPNGADARDGSSYDDSSGQAAAVAPMAATPMTQSPMNEPAETPPTMTETAVEAPSTMGGLLMGIDDFDRAAGQ